MTKASNYSYPIDDDWTVDEMNEVIKMFRVVEDAYEVGINRQAVLDQYRKFKQVANSKAYEKQLDKRFAAVSGYSMYQVVKAAKATSAGRIRLEQHE